MRRSCGLIGTLVMALLSLSPALKAGGEDEEVGFRFQYAAKFTCGFVSLTAVDRVIQGQCATAVAIHNPLTKDVTLWKKIALVFPPVLRRKTKIRIKRGTRKIGGSERLAAANGGRRRLERVRSGACGGVVDRLAEREGLASEPEPLGSQRPTPRMPLFPGRLRYARRATAETEGRSVRRTA
jgi:hypothetical protein